MSSGSMRAVLLATTTAVAAIMSTPVEAQSESATAAQATAPVAIQAADGASGDIIVTAQKRAESLQKVPITITTLNAADLQQRNITSIADLPRAVPTLKYGVGPGSFNTRFNLRGLGSAGSSAIESSVALFVDGVYVPRPAGQINTLLDVTGIEVLSGPQGTLFGRNASAGAISLRTGLPGNVLAGAVTAEAGTGDHYKATGHIDIPVSSSVSIRAAGLVDLFDGYYYNDLLKHSFGGLDTYAGRLTVKADLASNLAWVVRGDYLKATGNGLFNQKLIPSTLTPVTLANYVALNDGIVPNLNLYSRHNNDYTALTDTNNQNYGLSSDLSLTLDSGYILRLVNGYRRSEVREVLGDITSTSVPIIGRHNIFDSKSNSHELQFISPKGALLGGAFDFVSGIYYFHEALLIDIQNDFLSPKLCNTVLPPARRPLCLAGAQRGATDANFDQDTDSVAAYFQGTFSVTPELRATGGIRWTQDKKRALFVGRAINPAATFLSTNETTDLFYKQSKFTYRANLTWTPTPTLLLFATYSTGFKSGGFNSNASSSNLGATGDRRLFGPETIQNYEAGIKSQFLDRRVTFNATAYRMDVAGFQERAQDGSGIAVVRNVGNVRNQGVDVQLAVVPVSPLRITASISYLDSKFTDYTRAPCFIGQTGASGCVGGVQNLKGAPLTYAPKWSGDIGAELNGRAAGGRWLVTGDVGFNSKQNLNAQIDNSPQAIQRAYALINASATFYGAEDRWSLSVFGNNLADKGYCTSISYQPLEGPYQLRFAGGTALRCFVGTPRTIGVRAGLKF